MLKVDKSILEVDKVISENIRNLGGINRGLLSQNILSQLRNFIEYIAIKIYAKGKDLDPNIYQYHQEAIKEISCHGSYRFLYKFHNMIQISSSHYTVDKDGSERLMLKYYEYLLKSKKFMKQQYSMDVLNNIADFPLDIDTELSDYYKKIAIRVENQSEFAMPLDYSERFYIQKVKAFFVNQEIYYEVTFSAANSNISKFDRVIAFTKCEIIDNYAVRFSMHEDEIHILGKEMKVLIIDNFYISIRPCEWDNFSEIFGPRIPHNTKSIEYQNLMKFISNSGMPLNEFVISDDDFYNSIKKAVISKAKSIKIFELLDQCRMFILKDMPGANILKYLLYKMNNRVIKNVYSNEKCSQLSDLFINYGCIPFDQMPFCTSLPQHNPKIYDLFDSISCSEKEYELFARYIKNNTEVDGKLFTSINEIENFNNIPDLIQKYNSRLYYKHTGRRLEIYKNHIYLKEYVDDTIYIIHQLNNLSSQFVSQYTSSVKSWLISESYKIDDSKKEDALCNMFSQSRVALIYGSAGTGKSTMLKHVSNFWAEKKKIFLSNTHPAVDNMRRKVKVKNSSYYTIAKFLSNKCTDTQCDILFIDECSTVSNSDMCKVLKKAEYKLMVLVGDVFQIESIYFGNWFNLAQYFMPETSISFLTTPYRASNDNLKLLWDRVRNIDDAILETLVKFDFVKKLDESIFEHSGDDEIILCLNYDGLYGINNINRFLQANNPNEGVLWGINTYKIDDPILFNESSLFSPLIHNNSKGKIVGIYPSEDDIRFEIELEESINEIDAEGYDFYIIGESDNGKTIISFCINKYRSSDEDDRYNDSTIVPFQIAYAVSIHKAQGLEYDSVKIVITKETEERISHNIFYTAITRARKDLKIYWSPETEKYVLENLKINDSKKDYYLLKGLIESKLF